MAKQNIRMTGGGGGSGRAGGKGKPGYPVPQDMLPDDNAVFEDLVTHVVMDISQKEDKDEFVDKASPVDIVIRDVLDGILGEAESPEKLHKGIEHLDELKPDAFLTFLEKYKDLPLKGGLEVSEKVDGSARISFGVENGKVWTQSKNGPKRTSPEQYSDKPMFRAIRASHTALQNSAARISQWWPKNVAFMVAEVLYTKIPNSIEYGPNVVMVHGVHKTDGSVADDSEAKQIVTVMSKAIGGKLNDGKEPWLFEYKRVISPKDVMVDVKSEYTSIKQIYDELKKLEPNKLKAAGKPLYKEALAKFQAVQLALKKKLVGQLRKQRSVYGPAGGDIEGIVFRDLESGALTKLVDKEYFSNLNKFLWHYRELLDKGVKVGDKWEFGVMQKLRNGIADTVFGQPVAKTPGFVQQLAKFGNSIEIPKEANTPETRADFVISKYVEDNGLMKGDFMGGFKKELNSTWKIFKTLKKDWDTKKKTPLSYTVKDSEGKPVKKIKMDPLIKQRTDESFQSMEDTLTGIGKALEDVHGLSGDKTKRSALLKVFLGADRLEKLQSQLGGKEEVTEGLDPSDVRGKPMTGSVPGGALGMKMLSTFSGKLAARGIKIPKDPKFIGRGTQASVFDLANGNVIKVTQDINDAKACLKLQDKNLKHVAKIEDVFEFPDGGVYGIVMEKLEAIPGVGPSAYASTGEAKILNDAVHNSFNDQAMDFKPTNWKEALFAMIKIARAESTRVGAEKSKEIQKNFIDSLEILKKYQIPQMVDELGQHGITFNDFHAGNIMKRKDSSYALVDLGYSVVAGAKAPPVLEKKINEDIPLDPIDIIKANSQLLAKRGVNVADAKSLGAGFNGEAFDVGGNKVLKVTEDETEAKASNHVKGKKIRHVVHIFDVFKFKEGKWFGIVEEKLSKLSANELDQFNRAIQYLRENFSDPNDYRSTSAVKNMWSVPWNTLKKRVMRTAVAMEDDVNYAKGAISFLEKLGFHYVLKDLERNKIDYADVHSGNFMKRGSDLVVIDLGGGSQSPGMAPPKLEKKIVKEDLENPQMYHGIVKRHTQSLAKRGITVGKEIGKGANGIAFDIGGSKVLKVTIDEDEALASNHIKGQKLKHAVHVFDVFKFKTHPNNEGDFFGIVQEKLSPLPQNESKEIEESLNNLEVLTASVGVDWIGPQMERDLKRAGEKLKDPEEKQELQKAIDVLRKYKVFDVIGELYSHEISWYDMHHGNLMKRGSEIVAVDLGTSDSPGQMPPTIEQKVVESISSLLESARADKVGVTIGRFQPFHKGHAQMIRDLAKKFNKVIVIVAGNTQDKKNPFSFDTRVELMKKSLPDVISKIEIHKAQFGGKNSGYIPGVLSDISRDTRSSIEGDTAITILVGEDRFADIQKQIESARELIAKGTELNFDPDLAVVEKLADVKNDDEADRVSGTRVREALVADNREEVKKLLDPHVIANSSEFEDIYAKLKKELTGNVKPVAKKVPAKKVTEAVGTKVQQADIIDAVEANEEPLKKLGIDSNHLKRLGAGQDGIAYDVGGNKVMKVTTDKNEAEASNAILSKGSKFQHLTKIFKVFRFRPDTVQNKAELYGIVMEKLAPLSQQEKSEVEKIASFWLDPDVNAETLPFIRDGNYPGLLNAIKQVMFDLAKEGNPWDSSGLTEAGEVTKQGRVGRTPFSTTAPGVSAKQPHGAPVTTTQTPVTNPTVDVEAKIKLIDKKMKKYHIPEMMRDLKSLGIKFSDYHEDNIMKRGSEYVINDLGRSAGGLATPIPQLETFSRITFKNIIDEIMNKTIHEVGAFSGPGNTAVGLKAGSSAWSSPKNQVDVNSQELWQNSLIDLQLPGTGSIDAEIPREDVIEFVHG